MFINSITVCLWSRGLLDQGVLVKWISARSIHQPRDKAFSVAPHSDKQSPPPPDPCTLIYTHRHYVYAAAYTHTGMHADKPYGTDTHTHIIWGVCVIIGNTCDRHPTFVGGPRQLLLGSWRGRPAVTGAAAGDAAPSWEARSARTDRGWAAGRPAEAPHTQTPGTPWLVWTPEGSTSGFTKGIPGLQTERGSLVVMANECASYSHYKLNMRWNLDLNFQGFFFSIKATFLMFQLLTIINFILSKQLLLRWWVFSNSCACALTPCACWCPNCAAGVQGWGRSCPDGSSGNSTNHCSSKLWPFLWTVQLDVDTLGKETLGKYTYACILITNYKYDLIKKKTLGGRFSNWGEGHP